MKAFVTGSTGFLGINLIRELAKEGWEVMAFHRRTSDLSDLLGISGLSFAVGDVRDRDSVMRALPEGVDAVFHAASSVGFLDPKLEGDQYEINVLGTRNVVAAALAKNAKRFIATSTVLTYDYSLGRVDESSPANTSPKYAYVHSKYLAEKEVSAGIDLGLDAVFLHPTAIFGAYDKATWSKMFREVQRGLQVPFAPPSRASFCHMRRVVEAHAAAFHRGRRGEHYILGGPDASIMQITSEIARILGRRAPWFTMPGFLFKALGKSAYRLSTWLGKEPMVTPALAEMLCDTVLCDDSKARRELDYRWSSLTEMLLDCYQWMLSVDMLPPLEHKTEAVVQQTSP